MARRCELTGKGPIITNTVSHSHVATKRWTKPNLHKRRIWSEALDDYVTLRITNYALRSIDHAGGFDRFVSQQPDDVLSKRARSIKKRIRKAREAA